MEQPQFVYIRQDPDFEQRLTGGKADNLAYSKTGRPGEGGLFIQTKTGLRLRANRRVIVENDLISKRKIEFATNSLGYRNPEISPKSPLANRILFLGDSITMGSYLPEAETFVRLIEKQARQQGRNWETINAGVFGHSLAVELYLLKETGLSLEPDVVVLGFYLKDDQTSPGIFIPYVTSSLDKSWLLYHIRRAIALYRVSSTTERTETLTHLAWFKDYL
ncbi:MAG: hypothetical protein QGH25_13245, partial [Candidatus Latescibacteria bacterium]|nr:hypothetical protein [Candidatus Latescibacterota bacterium]